MKRTMTIILVLVVALMLYVANQTQAQGSDTPTATPTGHAGHHPGTEATLTPTPTADDHADATQSPHTGDTQMGGMGMMEMMTMMEQMKAKMDAMMGMEMSEELRAAMEEMRSMMDMMMSGGMMMDAGMMSMMEEMKAKMDTMMGMEMSEELRAAMEEMRGMMDMMMSGMGMAETEATAAPSGMEGMDMGGDGGGHAMEAISSAGVPPATENVGGQPLEYTVVDGVKVFELTARPVIWDILEGVKVTAWTYNGTVPGPMIRVTEGDQVRINFTNNLPEATTIHWHGISVPNSMDGVDGITQKAVEPGETFVYEFEARPAGTFMYHSHVDSDIQVGIGLYAPFIIDPAEASSTSTAPDVDVTLMLSEWRVVDGQTYPAMPMAGAEPNYFTINGKAFPATETINVKLGQRVRLRLIGIGQFSHPMHLHGMAFQVVAIDGYPVSEAARITRDTLNVAPGERYDIEFVASEPGTWLFHCHILHHVTNDGAEPGGLVLAVNVTE
ncbi:MAG: copper oxidase [Anaerolineae bacterium]|nr:copper oxidase [Anaerolineae bacterium]